jgi:hypothetical protein
MATGFLWSRCSLVITGKNWSQSCVNFFVGQQEPHNSFVFGVTTTKTQSNHIRVPEQPNSIDVDITTATQFII